MGKIAVVAIKFESPDSNPETVGTVGLRPQRAYRVELPAMYGTQRVRRDFHHTIGMDKYRSEIAAVASPGPVDGSTGSYLHVVDVASRVLLQPGTKKEASAL